MWRWGPVFPTKHTPANWEVAPFQNRLEVFGGGVFPTHENSHRGYAD